MTTEARPQAKDRLGLSQVVVVSGLPRSGTSMMMHLLQAGGVPILSDQVRAADQDNPHGYFEYEPVKQLAQGEGGWLRLVAGKAVKVTSYHLVHLPAGHAYRVIFMQRPLAEVIASQRAMLIRQGKDPDKAGEADLERIMSDHLRDVDEWLRGQDHVRHLHVRYDELVLHPGPHLDRINRFLGNELDVEAMARVVDPRLYRQRSRIAGAA